MILFGAAYYPEHRDPEKWDFDLDNMKKANMDCLRIGEFAWSRFEPSDGKYDFEWLDTFIEKAAKRDISVLLCPPLRTLPAWMVEQDRGVLIECDDGVVLEYGSRYTFCINHPLVQKKGRLLAEALSKHYGQNLQVIGWHLDNEQGADTDCHCPICKKKFQNWCKERHKTIENLNQAWGVAFWGLHFNKWEQIPTLRKIKGHPNPAHYQAWRHFRSDCTIEALKIQANGVRKHKREDQYITTNNQPWNPRTDYFEMAKELDICGTNYYPPYGPESRKIAFHLAAVRGYKKQNFQVHELRNSAHMTPGRGDNNPGPGEVERTTFHMIGNGADAIFYFRYRVCPFGAEQNHGTIVDYDGRPRRVYPEITEIGRKVKQLKPDLEQTQVVSDVALLYDFPCRWASETGSGWTSPPNLYMQHIQKIYKAIRSIGYTCDVTWTSGDFTEYKVLIVPMLPVIDDATVDKLVAFVENGGVLVWHPLSGIKNPDTEIFIDRIHPKLLPLIGCTIQEYITIGDNEEQKFEWNGKTYHAELFCDDPVLISGKALGSYKGYLLDGKPALIENNIGDGRLLYVTTFAETQFYKDFLRKLLPQCDVSRCLDTDIPKEVEICKRSSPVFDLIFLLNHSNAEQTVSVPNKGTSLFDDVSLPGSITLPPYGVSIIKVSLQ